MSTRASRRQVLALIALAAAPMPEKVDFDTCGDGTTIGLEFDRIAEARPWLGILGAALGDPVECDRARRDGSPYRALNAYPRDGWHGWRVMVTATEDVDEIDPLDDATREQLATIAAAPVREDLGALFATIVPDLPVVTAAIVGAALTEAGYQVIKAGEAR